MSNNNTTYNTSFDQTRSPINSPHLGLPAASLSPGTFKTNVNRAKSRRWVEAKTVDYGGGGWGDDSDFDDEEDYDPPPMGGRGSALQRSNSFDRGDDVVSPIIGNRGNGSAVPRIETTDVDITQPLPPTPLELEQRERALRGQSPSPHPKHQYPMQPKPQLSALPYTPSATSGPTRTPPLPDIPAGSFADPRELPDPPVKDKIPPPLRASPNISAFPSPPPPPPPPLREIGASGRDVVPPPLGMGPGPSSVPQPYANFAPFAHSLASVEGPLPIRKDSSPTSGGEVARANPSLHPTPSPSPPPVPQEESERPQYPPQWGQAPGGSPPPPPPPAEPLESSNQEVTADSGGGDRAFSGPGGGVKLNDDQSDFQGQQVGHVHAHSPSPPREITYSPPSVPSPSQSTSPEPARRFIRPAEIMARMNQAKGKGVEGDGQEGIANMSPPDSITSIPYSGGPNNLGRQSTESLPLLGAKSPERIRELRENLGRPSSRQSNSEDSRPGSRSGSRSGSRPNSRNGSRPSSRQGRVTTPNPYPPPTRALPAVPGSPVVPVAQHFQHPMDSVVTSQNDIAREEQAMSWNDDIISGYANSPEEAGDSQHTSAFRPPVEASGDGASVTPVYPTNHPNPDPGRSYPVQGPQMERVGFRSMVDHAFTRQDTLVPTPISPHRGDLNSPPGDMISPILPRDIPLPKSLSPPIISAPVPPPRSLSPPAAGAPGPPPGSPPSPVNVPPPPPKSPSPSILSNPTPQPKSLTPPCPATRLGSPALSLSMDLSRSSSPMSSMGPGRSATPVVPSVVPDGVEVELDQVTPDTAGPHRETEKPEVSDIRASASGLSLSPQPAGNSGDSVASSPEKDDLDRFLGELVRANTPTPRSQTASPQPPPNRASMDNAGQVVPPVPVVPEPPSPPQQFVDPVPQSQFQRPNPNRESIGLLSLYDSYWTDESVPPPPMKNPRRPSATPEAEVARQELEILAQTSGSGSEQRPTSLQPVPSHSTAEPHTPDGRSGAALPPVRIPENNFHADSSLPTPASVVGTPDSELMEMMIARKHYLARTQTGLSIRSDSTGRVISDDVIVRVKGDEMMFEKPDDVATPDVEFKGKAKEVVIGSEVENAMQDQRDQKIEETETAAPARVIGPDSEGMEAIGGPTRVPRPESPKGEDDGDKTPMQSDFARELVNQFSRPQTLMLKDTMPMPSGVLVMPPMPPKEEGEEVAPEVVDFSAKDEDEELVTSETDTFALGKSRTQGSTQSGVHPNRHPPGDIDVGRASQHLQPRDIAKLPEPEDRITAYGQATQAISQSPTGLNDWISWMMEENGGQELLKTQVEQRPGAAVQVLKKSTSKAFMGVGRPSVDDAPNRPPQQYQHQPVAQHADWAPQAQGHSGDDDPRANTASQAPGAPGGPVSPVVDKARGFFSRLKKGNNKEGQDGVLPVAQPSQKGQQYPPPSTAGSLRTLASSGSFQNSFTASGLVGVLPPNGDQKQGSQGQVTPTQGVPHQGQHKGHPQNLNQYPQGPQGMHNPPQGLLQDTDQGLHHRQAGPPQPPIPQGAQPLPQQRGYQHRPQQQEQEYGQLNNGGQFQQGLMGPPPQRGHPQPNFTERFPQTSQSPLPPPPVKDQPPQLAIPISHQQKTPEGHPVTQSQPPQSALTQAPLPQLPGQTAGDRPPAGSGSIPHSQGSGESPGHSQPPLTVSPPTGRSGQNTYPSPPAPQHPFPKRTDSLLSHTQRQNPAVNSPVTAQTPGRADSLTFAHEHLPPLRQSSTRSGSLASSIHPGGPAGRSDSITSSVTNSPTHPARSDSLNFVQNGRPPQQNLGWTGGPQGPPTNQRPPQHQNGSPQPPIARAVDTEDPNPISRSFSDRLPNHSDSYDHAGVARSQSYHVGTHPHSPNEGHQQQGFMYNRLRGPEPIQENPPSPRRPDDDLYAPPAHLRQQSPPTQHDQRGKEAQQRPQKPFDDVRERPYAAGLGPASQPGTQGYPPQGPQDPSTLRTGPEPQQSNGQNRFLGHLNQGPNQTPPQGYQNSPQGQQFQPRGPYQERGPTPQGQYQPGFQPRAAGYQTAQPPQQQQPPQGQFRQVSPSAMGAPGSLLRQHGQPQNQPEPEPGLKRNSTGLVKTLSNVSGRRESTDAGSPEFQGRNSQGQYEPSTSSSQGRRRSNLFSSLSAKVEKTGKQSPSEKQDPKPVEKAQRRGTSFLKLKSKESKDKRNSGGGAGKPAHKKGFSIDVFGRTGSMLSKLSKSPSPSPKQRQQQQGPPQQQQQGPPQGFSQQQFPQQQGPPSQSQSIGPRPDIGSQSQSAYATNTQAYHTPPQQLQPQQPQGPPRQWDGPQQQLAHPRGPVGQASPPQIKTLEPISQSPPSQQPPLPGPDPQEPRYDRVPIPTGYGRPQGEFYDAYNSGQSSFTQQLQTPQLQLPPPQSPEPSQGSPAPPGQQGHSQRHSDRGGDVHQNNQGREHRLSVDHKHSPDLSHRGSGVHGTPPPPSLSPQLSRQGTQASHTRSVSPQISNVDAHSVRNAPMSSVSENPTRAASVSSAQGPPPSGEGDRSTTGYVSPPHISPQPSVRDSIRYASPPPQASHTPPPQLAYPVASPVGLQQAMSEMEYEITRRSPTTQSMAPPPIPSKQPAIPPVGSSPAISQAIKPSSPAPAVGSSVNVGSPHSPSPPPTTASIATGKTAGTFYTEDSNSSSSKAGTPTRAVSPGQPVQKIPEVDYSQEKIAIQDGVEVEPPARGDDNDYEPVMSATAYPGQEWDPGHFGW